VVRLRTVSTSAPGWTRRRAGRGFVYLDSEGGQLPSEAVERIKALVIPPAWEDVWICPYPNGHIQALGTDAAGRRQYLYHPDWRLRQDQAKFDHVLDIAKRLPKARSRILGDLGEEEFGKQRILGAAVRLLDLGYFRLGSEDSVEDFGSYGLTTLEKRHVSKSGDALRFCFVGKAGIEHEVDVDDAEVCVVVNRLRLRRGGSERLLVYKDGRQWRELEPSLVNEYLRDVFDTDVTAKDFRTWHATVIAATALASDGTEATTKTARKKAVRAAVVEVSEYLGNTPAIARNSYVDPRVIDLYEDGTTIARALARAPRQPRRRQEHLEKAVLRMLSRAPDAVRRGVA
jgi:DNA topoisomerase I